MKPKQPEVIDFTPYLRGQGMSAYERNLLNSIIYEMREIESLSKWCYYNRNWIKREMALGKRIA